MLFLGENKNSQGGDKLTLNVSGAIPMNSSADDTVTVTHFSLDSWGQIAQKTTPFNAKIANQSQNPFNPFTSDNCNDIASNIDELPDIKSNDDCTENKNTNPFIDSNPFLGLLNPFKELQQPTLEKIVEKDEECNNTTSPVTKPDEVPLTTVTTFSRMVSTKMFICFYKQFEKKAVTIIYIILFCD